MLITQRPVDRRATRERRLRYAIGLVRGMAVPLGVAVVVAAAALHQPGMAEGAVFALIIAGAGVNIPRARVARHHRALRLLVAVTTAIFVVATTAGHVTAVVT